MQIDTSYGRNAEKYHIRGSIVARAHVGFSEEDWRYLVFWSRMDQSSVADAIRKCVTRHREGLEQEMRKDGQIATMPWMEDDWDKEI